MDIREYQIQTPSIGRVHCTGYVAQCSLHISLLHQNQFLCLAVLQGKLKVFYDFDGDLVELEPKEPLSEYLKISDADPKAVSLPCLSLSFRCEYPLFLLLLCI